MRVLKKYSARGGWTVLPVHYSHDPAKNSDWAMKERENYLTNEAWEREMECNFEVVSGVRAYPAFSNSIHVSDDVTYNPAVPLRLCCDFNVGIMVWPVVQVVGPMTKVIDEIVLRPASVPEMVREFRNKYPAHPAELWIYGDAAGNARSSNDQRSAYDLIRLSLLHYSAPVVFNVPVVNPPVQQRIDAVNLKLKTPSGEPSIIFSSKCVETIADMNEVLLSPRGGIFKTLQPDNPYSERTHASDALGYMIAREFPVVAKVIEETTKPRKPLKFGRLPGDI